jgi:hypothetical protein
LAAREQKLRDGLDVLRQEQAAQHAQVKKDSEQLDAREQTLAQRARAIEVENNEAAKRLNEANRRMGIAEHRENLIKAALASTG